MLQKYIYLKKLKKKKNFVFMHTAKSLKDKKKKSYRSFIQHRKFQKNMS